MGRGANLRHDRSREELKAGTQTRAVQIDHHAELCCRTQPFRQNIQPDPGIPAQHSEAAAIRDRTYQHPLRPLFAHACLHGCRARSKELQGRLADADRQLDELRQAKERLQGDKQNAVRRGRWVGGGRVGGLGGSDGGKVSAERTTRWLWHYMQ